MKHDRPAASRQRGATMIITLVMLVLITLVAVSSIRTSTMDEKMAGNARDRDKALQAAEAAVLMCLDKVKAGTNPAAQTPAVSTATPLWEVAANWATGSAGSEAVTVSTGTLAAAGLAEWPRCMYESLGPDNYRVTGRAVGGSTLTEVMLQATYSAE